jgi:hypothetical protein
VEFPIELISERNFSDLAAHARHCLPNDVQITFRMVHVYDVGTVPSRNFGKVVHRYVFEKSDMEEPTWVSSESPMPGS